MAAFILFVILVWAVVLLHKIRNELVQANKLLEDLRILKMASKDTPRDIIPARKK